MAAYESAPQHYVEKFRERALADPFGDELLDRLPQSDGPPRVLDVGCGPGADAAVFAEATAPHGGDLDVVGLDVSESLLRAAADHAPRARFVRGDMRSLPFERDSVEGLWSAAALLHLARDDAPGTLAEFARVLVPDGALFLSVMAREVNDIDAVETEDGRRFTFWRKDALVAHLTDVGFEVAWDSDQTDWHALVAVRE